MKRILTSLAAAGLLALAVAPAHAADGMINFTGKLVDATCDIQVNGGSELGTVTLPTVSTSDLTGEAGKITAGDTSFKVDLSNCQGGKTKVIVYFEAGVPSVNTNNGRLYNTVLAAGSGGTGATNVELELLDSTHNPIFAGSDTQYNGAFADITDGAATLQYYVRYYATGVTTAGDVASIVPFSLDYQ